MIDIDVNSLIGLVVAIFELGSAIGALSCLFIGDKLGRPKTMLVAGSTCTVGVIIQASTYSLAQILVGRIVTGRWIPDFSLGNTKLTQWLRSRYWYVHRNCSHVRERDS